MSIERVRAYFQAQGIADRILEFDVSSAIELTISELERYAKPAAWVDVCKSAQ